MKYAFIYEKSLLKPAMKSNTVNSKSYDNNIPLDNLVKWSASWHAFIHCDQLRTFINLHIYENEPAILHYDGSNEFHAYKPSVNHHLFNISKIDGL